MLQDLNVGLVPKKVLIDRNTFPQNKKRSVGIHESEIQNYNKDFRVR